MKIGILGTHGIGKTTLAMNITYQIKQADPGQSVGMLPELARCCPYPVNEEMTEESQKWIFHAQIKAELDCMAVYDILVCDRTVLDGLAYARWARLVDFSCKHIGMAVEWFGTYDQVIWMRPRMNADFPTDDGFRSESRLFQVAVDQMLEEMITSFGLRVITQDHFQDIVDNLFFSSARLRGGNNGPGCTSTRQPLTG